MRCPSFGSTALLALVVGLSLMPHALANSGSGGNYAVLPRVVATVIALAPRGLATLRTIEGATYEVVKGTTWRIGDTVAGEYTTRGRASWHARDCRKTS